MWGITVFDFVHVDRGFINFLAGLNYNSFLQYVSKIITDKELN